MPVSKGKIALYIVVLAAVIGLVAGGSYIVENRMRSRQIQTPARSADSAGASTGQTASPVTYKDTAVFDGVTYTTDHRIESYLFIGGDLSGNEAALGDDYHGTMADYILLMVLDYSDDSYGCIQINRNTITAVDELDENGKTLETRDLQICTAHWYGYNKKMSAENTVKAVSHLLGDFTGIKGYYVLNMKDIQLMNKAVGGVTLVMDEDHTDIDPSMTKGAKLTLTDKQAESYVRARKGTNDPTNTARMQRQKQYMEQYFRQTAEKSKSDPRFAMELWDTLRSGAETNLNGNAFSRIANMFLAGENKGILVPEGENTYGKTMGDGKLYEEFYADQKSLREIMTTLYSLSPQEQTP